MKKLYALLLPILAIAAVAATGVSSASAAEFHWYKCEKVGAAGTFNNNACTASGATNEFSLVRLPFTSAKTEVDTWGNLTLSGAGIVVKCKALDAGNIWNVGEITPGKDEITAFFNFNCTSTSCTTVTATASGLPWSTVLAAGPVDKISGVKITINCAGTILTFEGELSPKIVNATTTETTIAQFNGTTGELTEPTSGAKAKVEGNDHIVGWEHGETIEVKAP